MYSKIARASSGSMEQLVGKRRLVSLIRHTTALNLVLRVGIYKMDKRMVLYGTLDTFLNRACYFKKTISIFH